MSLQGSLSVERMCELVHVSRASFYRSFRDQRPVEEEMEIRSAIQQISTSGFRFEKTLQLCSADFLSDIESLEVSRDVLVDFKFHRFSRAKSRAGEEGVKDELSREPTVLAARTFGKLQHQGSVVVELEKESKSFAYNVPSVYPLRLIPTLE